MAFQISAVTLFNRLIQREHRGEHQPSGGARQQHQRGRHPGHIAQYSAAAALAAGQWGGRQRRDLRAIKFLPHQIRIVILRQNRLAVHVRSPMSLAAKRDSKVNAAE